MDFAQLVQHCWAESIQGIRFPIRQSDRQRCAWPDHWHEWRHGICRCWQGIIRNSSKSTKHDVRSILLFVINKRIFKRLPLYFCRTVLNKRFGIKHVCPPNRSGTSVMASESPYRTCHYHICTFGFWTSIEPTYFPYPLLFFSKEKRSGRSIKTCVGSASISLKVEF